MYIFLIIAILFLLISHAIIYVAAILLMGIPSSTALMVILGFLALSFIGSIFLGMRIYNLFSRIYYTLSMIWMGFLGYLLPASVLYIVGAAIWGISFRPFGIVLFAASIVTVIYGIVHAHTLVVKEVKVSLPHLPESWKGRKIVWISDVHLGQIHGKNRAERIVRKIRDIKPDALLIGGDLFDGSAHPNILAHIDPFRALSFPLGSYFIMGNHEGYGNKEAFEQAILDAGIHMLNNEKVMLDGVQLVGVDYLHTEEESEFKKVLDSLNIQKDIPSILLKHEPKHVGIAEQVGISLMISGHTHRAQQWPLELFARRVYGKFAYGLQRQGTIQAYTSSGAGTWGPPLRVGTDCEIVVFSFVD
jgi:predicted MPP superfamily phosphohydrolase